ncbi:hypothetical protein MMC34_001845 [Xylographa carneopallida]|nr:hypothetical protein [Xylographa carneopallida]
MDLTIDADDQRNYDLREAFCRVWEPNMLLRLNQADDTTSDIANTKESSTVMYMALETSVELQEPVTAISVNLQTLQYAVGNDEGKVTLFGIDGELIVELLKGFRTIEHTAWSGDGNLVAIADLSRRITIQSVNHKGMAKLVPLVLTIKDVGQILQIIFNSSADLLLICTAQFLHVWSLRTTASIITRPQTTSGRFWITHPLNSALLLGFGLTSIEVCAWADLQIHNELVIDRTTIGAESSDALHYSLRRKILVPFARNQTKMRVEETRSGLRAMAHRP